MRRKYQEELSRKEPEDRQASNTYAVDRLEEAGTAVAVATGTAGKRAAGNPTVNNAAAGSRRRPGSDFDRRAAGAGRPHRQTLFTALSTVAGAMGICQYSGGSVP